MQLSQINIRLLIALEALVSESHVSRAAETVGVTQAAMSNILKQLRELFQDPILMRTPSGLQPTRLALQITPSVRRILSDVESLVDGVYEFDPYQYKGKFVIGFSDILNFIVLPKLFNHIQQLAPQATIEIKQVDHVGKSDLLDNGTIDLSMGVQAGVDENTHHEALFEDELICVSSKSNPILKRKLTLSSFLEAKHIAFVRSPHMAIIQVEHSLSALGKKRISPIILPDLVSVFPLLDKTHLLAVLSTFVTSFMPKYFKLQTQALPFDTPKYPIAMFWNAQFDKSKKHIWLRDQVRLVMEKIIKSHSA